MLFFSCKRWLFFETYLDFVSLFRKDGVILQNVYIQSIKSAAVLKPNNPLNEFTFNELLIMTLHLV
jgi:hypothetical protein